jgi:ribosome-binding factor A
MTKNIKTERVDAEIQKELSMLLNYGVKDPRLEGAMIGVTKVKTTQDLRYAKVFVSIMDPDKTTVLKTLRSCAGFLRSSLSARLRIRTVPELMFELDDSFEYGYKIDKILKDLHLPPEETTAPVDENK